MNALLLSLTLTLTLAPAAVEYDAARTKLAAARDAAASNDHGLAMSQLEEALATISEFPVQLARDADAQLEVSDAQMRLAWLYLATNDPSRATQIMDDALRTTRGELGVPRGFGPALAELYTSRLQRLDTGARASIEVSCSVPCRVFVDERAATNPTQPLYIGAHRVWISAVDDSVEPASHELELSPAGASLSYGTPPPESALEPAAADLDGPNTKELDELLAVAAHTINPPLAPSSRPFSSSKKVLMPRWSSALGIAAGAVLVGVGGLLFGLDGKCQGDLDGPLTGPNRCPKIYANLPTAIPALALGSTGLLAFGVVLGVDVARLRARQGRQAMVSWTIRF